MPAPRRRPGALPDEALTSLVIGAVSLLLLLALPQLVDTYWVRIFTNVLYVSTAVAGLNIAFGVLGQISVGHGAFMAIGAYTVAVAGREIGLPFLLAVPVGALAGALIGLLFAIPAVRAEGKYFAMLTIALTSIVYAVISRWTDVTGGPSGILGFGTAPQPLPSDPIAGYYYISLGVAVVAWLFCARVIRSRWGRTLVGVRAAEPAMRALGVNAFWWKAGALVLSASLGGLAGVLQAYQDGFVQSEVYTITLSILLLGAVLVGGRGTALGPLLGAAILVAGPNLFAGLNEYQFMVYGGILLVCGLLAPGGVVGALTALVSLVRRTRQRQLAAIDDSAMPHRASLDELAAARARRATTADAPVVLSVSDVTKSFGGVTALDKVGFEVRSGEIVGLIGGNGSGKTTLANIVSGLLVADVGSVVLEGRDVTTTAAHHRVGLARTFQHVQLAPELSALDNVALGFHRERGVNVFAEVLGWPAARRAATERRRRAQELLDLIGIADVADVECGNLAYGHQRLVEMARAIAQRPQVLLFDEPAAGMGRDGLPLIAEAINVMAQQGVTVVLIEHHVDLVFAVCDRLVVLDHGVKIADGPTDQVRQDPKVLETYLGAHAEPTPRSPAEVVGR